MLSSKLVILSVAFLIAAALAAENDCGDCPEMPKHYEELNCTRRKDANGSCCSVAFECPDFKEYGISKCTDYPNSGDNCNSRCQCRIRDGEADFICPSIHCPEDTEPGCVAQKSLTGCCSHKTVCGEEAKQLSECYSEGVRYVEGNMIYPDADSCYTCICDSNWDNSTSVATNKNCQRVDCGIVVHGLRNIREGCVPVYFGEKGCCPIGYRCPAISDEVIPIEGRSQESDDPNMMCTFNKLKLHVGQELKQAAKCVTCTCNNPPLVECVRKEGCF